MRARIITTTKLALLLSLLALGALGLVACERDDDETTEAPATTAEEVATSFVYAYGAFDVEEAITYLAEDADISEMTGSVGAEGVEGTLDEFRLLIALLEAQGYKQMLDSCEERSSSAADTTLRCKFDFHTIRSDEIGVGPFSGSHFDLTVRDGEIVRASKTWATEEFSPQVWEPFARWVSTAYPEDAAVMYTDGTYSGARLTEESIRLWEQRSREYVDVKTAKKVAIAESAGDVEFITKVGNEWAPLFAKDVSAACRYMYGQPLCEAFFGRVGEPPEVGRPSGFQESFANATVERVEVKDAKQIRAKDGTPIELHRAAAEFSNGEVVEFIEETDAPQSDLGKWFVDDVGGNRSASSSSR
jgi:hypothetical protein